MWSCRGKAARLSRVSKELRGNGDEKEGGGLRPQRMRLCKETSCQLVVDWKAGGDRIACREQAIPLKQKGELEEGQRIGCRVEELHCSSADRNWEEEQKWEKPSRVLLGRDVRGRPGFFLSYDRRNIIFGNTDDRGQGRVAGALPFYSRR